MMKAIAAVASLLGLVAIIAVGWWAFGTLTGLVNTATKAQKAAEVAQVQAAQAQSDAAAQRINAEANHQQHVDIAVHQETSHAIGAAQGANQTVDPAGVLALRDGVCRLSTYRTSGVCGPLRPADTGGGSGANNTAAPS